jgi:ribonuclease HII
MKRNRISNDSPKPKRAKKPQPTLTLVHPRGKVPVGVDEVGIGCIFSRAYCAAVILPPDFVVPDDIVIKDSKKMSEKSREKSAAYIKEHALEWTVQWTTEEEIDRLNILQAKLQCWKRCLDALKTKFDIILVDGNRFLDEYKKGDKVVRHDMVIKGDNTYLQIAAASILAKTERDKFIRQLVVEHPELQERYGIASNVGYAVPKHMQGIIKYGISQFHRKTPDPCAKNPTVNPVKRVEDESNNEDNSESDNVYDISDVCFV